VSDEDNAIFFYFAMLMFCGN